MIAMRHNVIVFLLATLAALPAFGQVTFSLLDDGIDTTNNPATTAAVNGADYLCVGYAKSPAGSDDDTVVPVGARGTWTQLADSQNVSIRRGVFVFVGSGSVTNEEIVITVTTDVGEPWTETAWIVLDAVGHDTSDPDDAAVEANSTGSAAAQLGDVGTPDAGDAVGFCTWHETDEAVTATGFTGVGAVTGGSDLRTLHFFYDNSSPDETPQTDNFTSGTNSWGAIGWITNVDPGGGGGASIPIISHNRRMRAR